MPQSDDSGSKTDVVLGRVTGLYPNMNVSPYAVNNVKGQTFGNIKAGGNFTAPTGSWVWVIAASGTMMPGDKIPANPMPGSRRTQIDANGDWSIGDVPSAGCSCSAPFPRNQVIAWGLNSNGTYSIASAYFTGKCSNC